MPTEADSRPSEAARMENKARFKGLLGTRLSNVPRIYQTVSSRYIVGHIQGVPERSIRSQLLLSTIEGALRSKSH